MTRRAVVERWSEAAGRVADLIYAITALSTAASRGTASGDYSRRGRLGIVQRIAVLLNLYATEDDDPEDMVAVLAARIVEEDGPTFTATSLSLERVERLLGRGAMSDEMWKYYRWYLEVSVNLHGRYDELQESATEIDGLLMKWYDGYRADDSDAQRSAWSRLAAMKEEGKPEVVVEW